MAEVKKITVMGDGGWGTTLAILLAGKGHRVTLWSAFPEYAKVLKEKQENVKFLPSIKIPEEIHISTDLPEAITGARIIVLAIPSQYMRSVIEKIKGARLDEPILVSVSKGIENTTLKRMSEVIVEVLGKVNLAVLSGPCIAYEVARRVPTTAVSSSMDDSFAGEVQETFMTDRFRVYTNSDVIGVELGGALKNIIAIAAGISDGLGFGTNTKAALLTRGLVEITRLGVAMGANARTFTGLTGMGDLVTTCINVHGRNWWVGTQAAKGKGATEIEKETPMVAEGIRTAISACELSKKYNVQMPITQEVYAVLYEGKDPRQAVNDLMMRERRGEMEDL